MSGDNRKMLYPSRIDAAERFDCGFTHNAALYEIFLTKREVAEVNELRDADRMDLGGAIIIGYGIDVSKPFMTWVDRTSGEMRIAGEMVAPGTEAERIEAYRQKLAEEKDDCQCEDCRLRRSQARLSDTGFSELIASLLGIPMNSREVGVGRIPGGEIFIRFPGMKDLPMPDDVALSLAKALISLIPVPAAKEQAAQPFAGGEPGGPFIDDSDPDSDSNTTAPIVYAQDAGYRAS